MRRDLLLQIDPSAFDSSAGYILRRGVHDLSSQASAPVKHHRRDLAAASPFQHPIAEAPPCYHDLPLSASKPATSPTPPSPITDIGVGIDTARYGHYAAFLDDELQQAAPELEVAESAQGYGKLRQRFVDLVHKHGRVRFFVRLDVAGAYADNLLAWLHPLRIEGAEFSLSCGDPQRNKNYRARHLRAQEVRPHRSPRLCPLCHQRTAQANATVVAERQRLRHVALRLQAVVRQRTRLVNQLHQLLARTFPELAMLVKDITAGWVLELIHRYPTARLLAQATTGDLEAVPYLPHARIDELLAGARPRSARSTASWPRNSSATRCGRCATSPPGKNAWKTC